MSLISCKGFYNLTIPIVALLALACQSGDPHNGRIPLVGVGDTYLYKDEVDLYYAFGGQGKDSATYVDAYIEKWVIETLFYSKAVENVASDNDIEWRVELYRRNLILNDYQEKLVAQQLEPSLSDSEVQAFYEENSDMFKMDESLMKGYFLKVPARSPKMGDLRRWCIGKSEEELEKIEKYCLGKDAVFECFFEDWIQLSAVAKRTPLTEYQLKERLLRKSTIEFNDGGYVYFISADTLVSEGERKPLEMVTGDIREFIVNSKMASFIKDRKSALYNEALKKGEVKIFSNDSAEK